MQEREDVYVCACLRRGEVGDEHPSPDAGLLTSQNIMKSPVCHSAVSGHSVYTGLFSAF